MIKLTSVLGLLMVVGCTEYGAETSEPATVAELAFVPEGHGDGTGFTSKGGVVFTSVDVPARYAVVFECKHGKFVVQGEDDRHKALWSQFHEKDSVTVYYRPKLSDNKVVGFDFLRAEKRD